MALVVPYEQPDYISRLEAGDILFFPRTPFEISDDDRAFLLSIGQAGGSLHKNVAYKPAEDRVTGVKGGSAEWRERLRKVMRTYSERVVQWTGNLLPAYKQDWRIDYASFRPEEEEGRDLPLNKRNDLLHVDAFPSRPTNGDMILRVFTNINSEQSRKWVTSEPFGLLAPRWAKPAGLERIVRQSESPLRKTAFGMLRSMGARGAAFRRSPYDRFMLRFHAYLKASREYQETTPKFRFEFPANSTWLCFTDVVPHSVLAGRYALEQTFIISKESLANRELAPVRILERICGCPVVSEG